MCALSESAPYRRAFYAVRALTSPRRLGTKVRPNTYAFPLPGPVGDEPALTASAVCSPGFRGRHFGYADKRVGHSRMFGHWMCPGRRWYDRRMRHATLGLGVAVVVGFSGPMLAVGAPAGRPPDSVCHRNPPTVVGTVGDDVLVGTPQADVIVGRGGDDVLRGRAGDDRLCGGAGRDLLFGMDGRDRLRGGVGADVLRAGRGIDIGRGRAGDDRVFLGPGADRTYFFVPSPKGDAGNDLIAGQGGSDQISGGSGADRVIGGGGGDTLSGGRGHDTLVGGPKSDVVADLRFDGSNNAPIDVRGSDVIIGGRGGDFLHAAGGPSLVHGSKGSDLLCGGPSRDVLDGGPGRDRADHDGTGDLRRSIEQVAPRVPFAGVFECGS